MKEKRIVVRTLALGLLLALAVGLVQAQGPRPQAPSGPTAALGTAFTYQGHLLDGGNPADGDYDFVFRLYDAPGGNILVGTVTVDDQPVVEGLFTVELDFGDVFDGTALWLEIDVRPGSSMGPYTTLSPRQSLTASPYALYALNVAAHDHWGEAWTGSGTGLTLAGGSIGLSGSGATSGLCGESASTTGRGVYGYASATSGATYGVLGVSESTVGTGVAGWAVAASGITYGVVGQTDSTAGRGVYGHATATSGYTDGVHGRSDSTAGRGVHGWAYATSGTTVGVLGVSESSGGMGVYGWAPAESGGTVGVYGQSNSIAGYGVYGKAIATSGSTYGVYGSTSSSTGYAGYFEGDVHVTGDLSAGGTKPFKIDHPLDPADRYLYHYSVESSEVLNQYTGNVILGTGGEAWVELPAWFEAINTDFRYQLTPIGAPGPSLYIAQEIQNNRLKIAGGEPGMRVSWMVVALRDDPYIRQHPPVVEKEKPAGEGGTYLYPELYGQPEEMGLDYQRAQDLSE